MARRPPHTRHSVNICIDKTCLLMLKLQSLLALTEDQVQDLMLMRQLYLTKRGLLAMERKALVDQMGSGDGAMPHPSDNITKMADLATCLKENAAEDHYVHRRVARAAFRGVRAQAGTSLLCMTCETALDIAASNVARLCVALRLMCHCGVV